jgi:hypothetical protein
MTRSTRAFFATALVALLGASILYVLVLGGYRFLWNGFVHLMLFGWITAMILGVSYHTMPVFSGRDFPFPWLIDAHLAAFGGGITLAIYGFAALENVAILAGLLLQFAGAMLFVVNSVLLFVRGRQRPIRPPAPPIAGQRDVDRIASQATRLAAPALAVALLLLVGVYARWISATWILAAEHLAALGWIMLMVVGVAAHVLPRFSGHATRGPVWLRRQLRTHLLALGMMVLALGMGWTVLFVAGAGLMALALALFGWTIWPTLVAIRARPQPITLIMRNEPR